MHGCASTDWSAVSSATANTALAGVLAGFMINGIVMLLSTRPGRGQRAGYVQAAGLLFTALVTLGLDAYLFALVTGDSSAQACRRAWTEAMFAAGLLGIGAVAVIVSVVFLLGVFFWESSPAGRPDHTMDESKEMLETLCMWLRPGVALIVMLFLWVTGRSYISSIFDDRPPHWATSVLTGLFIVDLVVIGLFTGVYIWVSPDATRTRAREAAVALPQPTSGMPANRLLQTVAWVPDKLLASQDYAFLPRFRLLNGLINLVWQGLQPDEAGKTRTLKIAIFTASGYSLLSAVFSGVVIYGPASFWVSSSAWAELVYTATVVWVLLVALIPLGSLLAPTFGPRRAAGRPGRPANL
jgi:hypothetical protein